jgi:EAL domain-containing protein (putative c-di-GMP-specific phosphodiesterase class I)
LQQFKVEKLKIDQSFVRDIGEKSEGMGIIRAIIQLGKTLKLTVIAEGVETDSQMNTLQALECNEAQGYLISKPLRPDDFRRFYQEWTERDTKA